MMKKIFLPLLVMVVVLKTEAQSSVFTVVDDLLLKGNYQEALIQLKKEPNKTVKVYDKTASIYQSIGDYNKAVQFYEKALVVEDREDLKVKLGVAYNSAGFPSKAILIYEDIIKKDTSNLLVAHNLGKLYLSKNHPAKAAKIYRVLKNKDSLNPNFPYQLGKALEKQGENLKMGQSYLDAFNIDTLHLKSIYELATFFKTLRVRDSSMLFIDKGLKIDSVSINFLQLKANALYFSKDFNEAIKYLTKLVSLNFKSVTTYEMFGMCHLNLKAYEQSEIYFRKALKFDFSNPKIWYRLGSLYYEQENFKPAEIYLTQSIIKARPDIDKQYFLLGLISTKENNLKKAIDYFDKSFKNNSTNYNAKFQLALTSDTYYKDKKIAYKHYQQFIERFESSNKEMTIYASNRIQEIKKQLFIEGEIVE